MKKRILSILLTAALACMVLAGCKKNVGTPEDNAVVETEEGAEEEEEADICLDTAGSTWTTLILKHWNFRQNDVGGKRASDHDKESGGQMQRSKMSRSGN